MSKTTKFDTSDKVQLKGNLTGVTRLSKNAKALLVFGSFALLCFIMFAIYTVGDDEHSSDKPNASGKSGESDKPQQGPKFTLASAGDLDKGVSDGQANPAPTIAPSPGVFGPGTVVPPASSAGASSPGESGIVVPGPQSSPGGPRPTPGSHTAQPPAGGLVVPAPNSAGVPSGVMAGPDGDSRRKDMEKKARESGMEFGGGDSGGMGLGSNATPLGALAGASDTLAALAAATQNVQRGAALPMPVSMGQGSDPNKQERKEQFLKEAQANPANYLKDRVSAPVSEFELKAGWKIPIALESGINTDLPGQVTARVRENVYDSATGKHLLIPQETLVIGSYDSQIVVGQSRVLAAWQRMIFPDGSSINLEGMPAGDQAGYAGLGGDVNNHYGKIFGSAIMLSLISSGIQLSQPQTSATGSNAPSSGQTVAGAVGQQLGQVSSAMIQRNMQVQPTITVEPGTRLLIMVTKDMVFPSSYVSRKSRPRR